MNGHASNIRVTLHKDGSSLTIEDDGRGIPVDLHPQTKKSALEVIFTVLHAGGKFESGNYKTAGGLHGVGASVVNALSRELVATVRRDGSQWEMTFKQGKPTGPLKKTGAARGSGTTVFFRPDPIIFPKVEFDAADHPRAAGSGQLPAPRRQGDVRGRVHRAERRLPARRRRRRLPEEGGGRALGQAGARRAVRAREGERRQARARAAVDRVHRRTPAQLRQRHSHRLRRHARSRLPRRPRQGRAQLHRDPQPLAEGRHAHRRRHPRGGDRHPVGVPRRTAVPGADQGSPEQPRGAVGRGRPGAARRSSTG